MAYGFSFRRAPRFLNGFFFKGRPRLTYKQQATSAIPVSKDWLTAMPLTQAVTCLQRQLQDKGRVNAETKPLESALHVMLNTSI